MMPHGAPGRPGSAPGIPRGPLGEPQDAPGGPRISPDAPGGIRGGPAWAIMGPPPIAVRYMRLMAHSGSLRCRAQEFWIPDVLAS